MKTDPEREHGAAAASPARGFLFLRLPLPAASLSCGFPFPARHRRAAAGLKRPFPPAVPSGAASLSGHLLAQAPSLVPSVFTSCPRLLPAPWVFALSALRDLFWTFPQSRNPFLHLLPSSSLHPLSSWPSPHLGPFPLVPSLSPPSSLSLTPSASSFGSSFTAFSHLSLSLLPPSLISSSSLCHPSHHALGPSPHLSPSPSVSSLSPLFQTFHQSPCTLFPVSLNPFLWLFPQCLLSWPSPSFL